MKAERRVEHHLLMAWVASLDCDPDAWGDSKWAHIIFLVGQALKEHDPHVIESALQQRLERGPEDAA